MKPNIEYINQRAPSATSRPYLNTSQSSGHLSAASKAITLHRPILEKVGKYLSELLQISNLVHGSLGIGFDFARFEEMGGRPATSLSMAAIEIRVI